MSYSLMTSKKNNHNLTFRILLYARCRHNIFCRMSTITVFFEIAFAATDNTTQVALIFIHKWTMKQNMTPKICFLGLYFSWTNMTFKHLKNYNRKIENAKLMAKLMAKFMFYIEFLHFAFFYPLCTRFILQTIN